MVDREGQMMRDDIPVDTIPITTGPNWGTINAPGLGVDEDKLRHYHEVYLKEASTSPGGPALSLGAELAPVRLIQRYCCSSPAGTALDPQQADRSRLTGQRRVAARQVRRASGRGRVRGPAHASGAARQASLAVRPSKNKHTAALPIHCSPAK